MQNLGDKESVLWGSWHLSSLFVLFSLFKPHMVPHRTVSFKCCPMHLHSRGYVCRIYEKAKDKFLGEYHVVRIGKTKHASLKGLLEFLVEPIGEGGSCNKSLL